MNTPFTPEYVKCSVPCSICAYEKGPCIGYKIQYGPTDPYNLDLMIGSLSYSIMITGQYSFNGYDDSHFIDYLQRNFNARDIWYNWNDSLFPNGKSTCKINYSDVDKKEVAYNIIVRNFNTTLIIDFAPVWYIMHREPKWYEINSKCGQKIYL